MTRRTTRLGLALGAVAGLLGAAYYWLFRRPLARTQGALHLPGGLRAPAEIIRDRWGVPHIYAENRHDVIYAQGFAHAQDRLWQMDLQRRLVAGRLSEVMGATAVPVDRWMRILGMRRVAEQEASLTDSGARSFVEAYAGGVNARISQGRLPIEFALLRYRPEPWTVADSLGWIKMMSWSLSVNWETEIIRAQLIARLGPERAAELEPAGAGHWPCIIPLGMDHSTLGAAALERADAARPFTGPSAHQGLGSNSWVLAGSRTATGAPLLANDMHLPMGMPALWYENHLVGGDLNATGITFPGITNTSPGA